MPDLIKRAAEAAAEINAGYNNKKPSVKKEKKQPDYFVVALTGKDDDDAFVIKKTKSSQVAQKMLSDAKKRWEERAEYETHPDYFVMALTGRDDENTASGEKTSKAEQVEESLRRDREERLAEAERQFREYHGFSGDRTGLARNYAEDEYTGEVPDWHTVSSEMPDIWDIPEVEEPEGKVYTPSVVSDWEPTKVYTGLDPLGHPIIRNMTVGEFNAYKDQQESKANDLYKEQQRNWQILHYGTSAIDKLAATPLLARPALETEIEEMMQHPDDQPAKGEAPKWKTDMAAALEISGANNVMRSAIQAKKFTQTINELRAQGRTDDEIIEALISLAAQQGVTVDKYEMRDLIALNAVEAQRAEPGFFSPSTLKDEMAYINSSQRNEPWTSAERTMLTHLYAEGGQDAVDQYKALKSDELVTRRAANNAEKLKGRGYEALPTAILNGVWQVAKNAYNGVRAIVGDMEPMKLTQIEANARAYIAKMDTEEVRNFVSMVSDLTGIGLGAVLDYMNPLAAMAVGALTSTGERYQDELEAGSDEAKARNNAILSGMLSLSLGMLSEGIDEYGGAFSPLTKAPLTLADSFIGGLASDSAQNLVWNFEDSTSQR